MKISIKNNTLIIDLDNYLMLTKNDSHFILTQSFITLLNKNNLKLCVKNDTCISTKHQTPQQTMNKIKKWNLSD